MLQKKPDVTEIPDARKRLADLYARRSTIDTLIRSLEEYDRFRPKPEADGAISRSDSARYFERSV